MKPLRIGVLGLGRGYRVAEIAMKFSGKTKICAVCDTIREKADKAGKELGVGSVYYDYGEMLKAPGLDAVYVATPIPMHADHVIMAMKAGKHVLSEVTAMTDMRDAERMLNAADEFGKVYMLAENYCYLKTWNMVMKMVRNGVFGEIYYAEGDYLMNFRERDGFPYIGGWRQNVYYMHRGHVYITHSLGPLMQAFDYEPVVRVSCMGAGQHPRSWGLRADNTCNLLLQTKSEKMIRLRQDFLSYRPDNYLFYAIQGTKGVYESGRKYPGAYHEGDRRVRQDCVHKVCARGLCKASEWIDLFDLREYLPDMSEGWLPDDAVRKYGVYNEGVGVMFNDFAAVIDGHKQNELTLRRSLNWTAAGVLSEESADRNGEPVMIPDFREKQ
ncbi:MAG: Gfo/Idh/MocA family oxidoreductase [Victivallales bacterium]|nr:Gfo/Idh/MocA family oxidoreductase [Victivallales bacterium]